MQNTERKPDIRSLTLEELTDVILERKEKKFRAQQIYGWLHEKLAISWEEMKNVPERLKQSLAESYSIYAPDPIDVQISKLDGTRKYLFALEDQNVVESVWMQYHHGNSVCISTQVGCRMGCRFCASTIGGKVRDLTTGEMLGQIYQIQRLTGERVSNLVLMGTGEPLDNYDNVLRLIRMLSDEKGLNISQRNITLSTCGIVPGIIKLAEEKLAITLALSLHCPTQEKREKLLPIAKKYELSEVLDACRYYYKNTGRRLTFEYSLVKGENDSTGDALTLAELLRDFNGHVNLIPVNPIKERSYRQSEHQAVVNFKNKLEKCGINVTIRREMGRDIDGACGQLRRKHMDSDPNPEEQTS